MGQINVEKNVGGIEGLCVITPAVHGDDRGYFMETYNENDMKEAGIDVKFVQDNQSMSTKGVLRGLHFQKHFPQCKLVRAVRGTVFDAVVDLRQDSKTYGKWYGVTLSAENKKQFLIPEGFAHGFLVLSDEAEFCYKVNDFWHPNDEGGMAWNDPEIGIEWPAITMELRPLKATRLKTARRSRCPTKIRSGSDSRTRSSFKIIFKRSGIVLRFRIFLSLSK
jgi:dTDP-4-dehydrorhamnose 3,5-epimerase